MVLHEHTLLHHRHFLRLEILATRIRQIPPSMQYSLTGLCSRTAALDVCVAANTNIPSKGYQVNGYSSTKPLPSQLGSPLLE